MYELPDHFFLSTEKRSWFYKKFMSGGIDRNCPDNEFDNNEHVLMKFFRDNVAAAINKGWVKALIIIIFGGYIAGWYLSCDIFIFYNFSFHPINDKQKYFHFERRCWLWLNENQRRTGETKTIKRRFVFGEIL